MSIISRYLSGFFGADNGQSGLYEKTDGSVWYRKPDGSEAEVGSGGSQPLTNDSPNQAIKIQASGRQAVGMDFVNGQYWYWNSGTLFQSQSLTAPSFTDKTKPAALASSNNFGVSIFRWIDGNIYLQGNDGTTASIWRATPVANPGTFTWSAALKSFKTGSTSLAPAFCGGSQFLFAGEYGDPSGGPSVYRSPDGTTWTEVLGPLATTRHIHAIAEDPYNPGVIYMTVGDAGAPSWVYRSTNHGAAGSWTAILSIKGWQGVQISFSPNWVYIASDQFSRALTVYAFDRGTVTPRWVANDYHYDWAVPGGIGARTIADLVATSGSVAISSAAGAQFTQADVGRLLRSVYTGGNSPVFPDRTFIASVTNATTATASANATASGTFTATIEGDRFFGNAYFGAVDPSTERYYCFTNDSSQAGTVPGCFAVDAQLPLPGRLRLVSTLHSRPTYPVFIGGGYVFCGTYQIPIPA